MTTPKVCRFFIVVIGEKADKGKSHTERGQQTKLNHERRDEEVAREEPPTKKGGPGQEAMRLA